MANVKATRYISCDSTCVSFSYGTFILLAREFRYWLSSQPNYIEVLELLAENNVGKRTFKNQALIENDLQISH